MNPTILKSFELGRVEVLLGDYYGWYYVAKKSENGYFLRYSALEDAEEAFMEQISNLTQGEI